MWFENSGHDFSSNQWFFFFFRNNTFSDCPYIGRENVAREKSSVAEVSIVQHARGFRKEVLYSNGIISSKYVNMGGRRGDGLYILQQKARPEKKVGGKIRYYLYARAPVFNSGGSIYLVLQMVFLKDHSFRRNVNITMKIFEMS